MDKKASWDFLSALKVLTLVHHLNLVRLIGYCVAVSLFLVYEFAENGNLIQHLSGSPEMEPLRWCTRVQIALDIAIGLEYLHEHIVPVYIHGHIKSPNILIDKNYHGKVAGFGLTKPTAVGSTSLQACLVGTYGYMPPEYAQYGEVSQKFEEVLILPEPKGKMHTLVDPRLKDDYPIDSVCKMARLAKFCTHENPQLTPSMRSIVVALTTLL